MKKGIALIAALILLAGLAVLPASAAELPGEPVADATYYPDEDPDFGEPDWEEPSQKEVYVTIAVKGTLKVADEPVMADDLNGDGRINIDEVLFAAHEAFFVDGAEAGYASGVTDYGLSLKKLWGDTSGNFGYYLDHSSAMSLDDDVQEASEITAFVYSDAVGFSDLYCWLMAEPVGDDGKTFTLTLTGSGFDEFWVPVSVPVEGAVITVNGKKTDLVTNEEGQVTFVAEEAGELLLSAVSEDQTLVPPALRLTVEGEVANHFFAWLTGIVSAVLMTAVTVLLTLFRRNAG